MTAPRTLLLAPRLKDYWASSYGQARVARVITPAVFKPPGLARHQIAGYFALALYARLAARGFDVVVCVDRHLALAFGAVKQLTGLRTPVVAHQFILPDADDSRRKRFAAMWDRLASKGLNRVLVNSTREARAYADRLAPGRALHFVPLAVPPMIFDLHVAPGRAPSIFSGGGAMRDYPTLMRSVQGLDCPVQIVTFGPGNLEGEAIPPNVTVNYNLPFVEFLGEMAAAWVVVLPLRKTERSAGQATLVYAQALGRAVIVSDVPGVRDYITPGVNGLVVPPENPDSLRHAIQSILSDAGARTRLETAARAHALGNYSFAEYDRRMGQILAEAVAEPQ